MADRDAQEQRYQDMTVAELRRRAREVEREELRVEREPITDANRDQAMQGPDLAEAEHEVVLHEQRPVAHKEVVPKERVRLGAKKVKDQRKVARKLRKERIELEEDPTEPRR